MLFLVHTFSQRANVNASTISNSTVELNFPELAEDSLNLTIIKCTLPTELSSKDIDVCENYAVSKLIYKVEVGKDIGLVF